MSTSKEILDYVKNHPSGKVKLAVADIDGILRGKYVAAEKFASLVEGRLGFCDVTFGWDAGDLAYENGKYTGWHTGYPDAQVNL
jgi:glutamine synthetase